MKISEVRDDFLFRYKLACRQRQTEYIELPDGAIANLISKAQQDIQKRILIIESSYTITTTAGVNTYSLPVIFLQEKLVYDGTNIFNKRNSGDLTSDTGFSGESYSYAIKYLSRQPQIIIAPVPSGAETITVYYFIDTALYQPSQSSQIFNGTEFSGYLLLPGICLQAITYHMMGQIFPDYMNLYEAEIRRLKGHRAQLSDLSIEYNFGIPNDYRRSGEGLTGGYLIPETDTTKQLIFNITEGSFPVIVKSKNWTDEPEITVSTGYIEIQSDDFTNYTHIDLNNKDLTFSLTGTTITIATGTGYGDLSAIIKVY